MKLQDSYNDYKYWEKYQSFFPEDLRSPTPNQVPEEEWWPWENYKVHLDRVDLPDSSARIILVHGAGGYGRFLSPLGFMLSRAGYSWVAPDLPGYGLTQPRDRNLDYGDWVSMLSSLIDHELKRDPKPIVLFGLSLGGMLTYQAAARNGKISGIIATTLIDCRDPSIFRRISKYESLSDLSSYLMKKLSFALDSLMIPVGPVSKMDHMSHNKIFNRLVLKDKVGGDNWVPIKFLRTLATTGIDVEPENFHFPVLLAHPAADTWTPYSISEPFFKRLGGQKTLVLLENCGHAPIELPGIFQLQDAVKEFLKGLFENSRK